MRHSSLKPLKNILVLGLLLWSVCGSALAQQGGYEIEYELVKTSVAPERRIMNADQWSKIKGDGRHLQLNAETLYAQFGEDAMAMHGRMIPIGYRDPRADSHQVQYIEDGFKIDCKANPIEDNAIRLVLQLITSGLAPDEASAVGEDTYKCESTVVLRRGQTAIVTSTKGILTSRYLAKVYPGTTFGESDSVLLVVTVR